jgi:UDP-glucose 4-epimerase
VVEALLEHDTAEVVVYDNFARGTINNLRDALRDERVRVFEAGGDILREDILDDALQGADGVFHLAALWLLHCHDYPRSAFEVNVKGTFNVLDACVRKSVGRLVFSSSASVYGDAVEEPMTEDHPFHNKTFYGASKIAGEAMAHAYHHRYGLDYVGLRYMNVYGPRQDYRGAYVAVIMKILDAIEEDRPIELFGDGRQSYDFVHVADCARANVCAMAAEVSDSFYNVGTGRRTSLLELAEALKRLTGSEQPIVFREDGVTFVKNRVGSTAKARAEIGFDASVKLENGLEQVIEWRQKDQRAAVAVDVS